jgi:hypothetical protein
VIENGAVCGCLRADHRSLRDHVVCYHKAVAKACVEFPCWDCNRAFTSQKKLNAHTKSACKATRKERKRKRSSHETETTPDSQSKTDSESTSESKPEKKQKAEKAETQCCGYHLSAGSGIMSDTGTLGTAKVFVRICAFSACSQAKPSGPACGLVAS